MQCLKNKSRNLVEKSLVEIARDLAKFMENAKIRGFRAIAKFKIRVAIPKINVGIIPKREILCNSKLSGM